MISQHPDSRLLSDYAAGSLPLAQSVCVSLHLGYCEQCQRQSRKLQQVGAGLFEQLAPQSVDDSMLDGLLARLDEEPPLSYSTGAEHTVATAAQPPLLQRLMSGNYDDLEWQGMGSALQISHLKKIGRAHV